MPTSPEQKAEGWLSVTEVLDAFIPKGLLSWYLKTGAKEAKRLSTVALKIGSRVDELIQDDITKGSYKLSAKDPIEVTNCMEAWKQFKQDYNPRSLRTQIVVNDGLARVTGHVDLITDNTLIDVKCASSIKHNHWLQVGAYYSMLDQVMYNGISEVAILRLDKNLATYQFMTIRQAGYTPTKCSEVFYGLLEAYRFYQTKAEKEE
mgnify:CR=1 FL=1